MPLFPARRQSRKHVRPRGARLRLDEGARAPPGGASRQRLLRERAGLISIVITFYDNRRMLSLCLRQLLPTLRGHDVEVIVLDDNPERRTARAALGPRAIRVVRAPSNIGYSAACNLGVDA